MRILITNDDGINAPDLKLLTKKALREIIGRLLRDTDIPTTAEFLDNIKDLGYGMAFKGGLSFSLGDVIIPDEKENLVNSAVQEVDKI